MGKHTATPSGGDEDDEDSAPTLGTDPGSKYSIKAIMCGNCAFLVTFSDEKPDECSHCGSEFE